MFGNLVEKPAKLLPDFEKLLAIDSKAIESYAAKKNKYEKKWSSESRCRLRTNSILWNEGKWYTLGEYCKLV